MTDYVGKLAPEFNEPPPPYTDGRGQPLNSAPPQSGYNGQGHVGGNVTSGYVPSAPQAPAAGFSGQPIHLPPGTQLPPNVQVAAVIVNVAGFGPHSTSTTCGSCNQHVMTETRANPGLLTWILSGTLLLIGCWAGCCLIPCCITDCQDIEHRCPNCKAHLGTYRRI